MKGKGEVIPYKRARRISDNKTASIGGALPWTGAPGDTREDWAIEQVGWTIRWADSTTGIGRPPFETREEAERWLSEYNARRSHPSVKT